MLKNVLSLELSSGTFSLTAPEVGDGVPPLGVAVRESIDPTSDACADAVVGVAVPEDVEAIVRAGFACRSIRKVLDDTVLRAQE